MNETLFEGKRTKMGVTIVNASGTVLLKCMCDTIGSTAYVRGWGFCCCRHLAQRNHQTIGFVSVTPGLSASPRALLH